MIVRIFKNIIKKISKYFNYCIRIKLNNHRIKIPIIGTIGLSNTLLPKHETWLNKLIIDNINDGLFVDIGANIGQTLLKFKSLFPEKKYIGFEPNPNCVQYLYNLIQLNKINNCIIIPIGLGDRNSINILYSNFNDITHASGGATFIKHYRQATIINTNMYLPVFTGDYVFSNLFTDKIGLLKIDVEGGELEVLNGLKNNILKDNPNIIIEILPTNRENSELRKKIITNFHKFLKNINYEIFNIEEFDYDYRLIKIDEIDVLKSDLKNYNYLLKPKE